MQDCIELGIGQLALQPVDDRLQMMALGFDPGRLIGSIAGGHGRVDVGEEVRLFLIARWQLIQELARGREAAGEAGADALQHHAFHEAGGSHATPQCLGEFLGGLIGTVELGRGQQRLVVEHGEVLGRRRPDVDGDAIE